METYNKIFYKDFEFESATYAKNGGSNSFGWHNTVSGCAPIGMFCVATTGNTSAWPYMQVTACEARIKITNTHPDYQLTVGCTVRVYYINHVTSV